MMLLLILEVIKNENCFNNFMDYLVYSFCAIHNFETWRLVFIYYPTNSVYSYFLNYCNIFRSSKCYSDYRNTYFSIYIIFIEDKKINETYTLSNGVKISKLGLGTWLISNEDMEKLKNITPIQNYGEFSFSLYLVANKFII